MANHDAFTLANSPFNDFLYAEVGLERNGSGLTVLSMLARRGDDPWDAVARWAALPRPAVVDLLLADMRAMPLCNEAIEGAQRTAERLAGLLPAASGERSPKSGGMVAFYCAIAIVMAINGMILAAAPHDHAASAPATTSVVTDHPAK